MYYWKRIKICLLCNVDKQFQFAFMLLLVVALSFKLVHAQSLYVDRIGLNEGLTQNSITTIIQDKKGFMWFGTQDGLNRYNGYEFKNYSPNPEQPNSISNKSIRTLLIDKEGVLWIGTLLGLNRYIEQSDEFIAYYHEPNNPNSLSENTVYSIIEDKRGNFWAATLHGLNRFDREKQIFERYIHNPNDDTSIGNNVVNILFEDSKGNLWLGTDRGVNQYKYDTDTFVRDEIKNPILQSTVVTTISEDAHERLWVGTSGHGLFVYDKNNGKVRQYTHDALNNNSISSNKINIIYKNRRNQMWIGTDDGGLNLFDEQNNRFIRYSHNPNDSHSLSGDNVFSLYEDAGGVFWIGSYTFGISKFNPYSFSLSLVSDKPTASDPNPSTDVRPFLVDKQESVWVGSSYKGVKVTRADGSKRDYFHDPNDDSSLSSNRVYALYEDKAGTVWVGTLDGWLNEYDPVTDSFTRYHLQPKGESSIRHGKVRAMLDDKDGLFWIALDGGGVHTFNRETKEITHFHYDPNDPNSLSDNRVFVIHEDRKQQLWFVTYGGGLAKFNRKLRTFTAYRHNANDKNSLSNDFLLAICEDYKKDVFWLGSAGGGIDRFDLSSETFTNYREKDGLPNSTLYGILQDDNGQLWVTHNKGISRFNPETEEFYNYDEQEGLQSNEFNGGSYYKSADGKFYFGGIHGYNAFYPDQIIDNPHPPQVYITDFQLFNKSVKINEKYDERILLKKPIIDTVELTLSYKDTVFSFEFAALDYALSSKNQYAYRMQGLEDDWNYVDSRRRYATYTTLPPGDYTFQVKASNNHGVWNDKGVSLPISITPPFWQTWWFRVCAGLFLIMFAFAFYSFRVRSIRERNKILQNEVKSRTIELQQEKTNLEKTLLELGETKDALIEAAHKAGMADTATGVLHNVGNLLNSVNTSANIIREAVFTPVSSKFIQAHGLINEHKQNLSEFIANDPKGNKLVSYLLNLAEPFQNENAILRENILRLKEKIIAIKETIAAQQRYAKGGSGFYEELSLQDMVEDSLLLQSGSIGRHEITVERFYGDDIPMVKVQKAKLVQILINLYQNAKESMDECIEKKNILSIGISKDQDNAYISYSDTGLGIEKDKLETIFAQGFTTKSKGHGFGLHSCANYMTEMGGKLWAESEGSGKGAKFVLSFPLRRENDEPTGDAGNNILDQKIA